MADNVSITSGSGTAIAADEISGAYYQRIKIVFGSDGVNSGDVSAANPFPISVASLPLPSGAATAAKQPSLGTAGSASADVITVQGIASMTALKVDGSAVTQPVSGSVSIAAVATGGATFSKIRSAASTNATNLKASAGKVVSIFLQNNTTTQQFVKLHNVASTPTAGASVALSFVVNPGDTVTWHGGDQGMAFGTGIGYTITSGQAESDTGNATADGVLGFITWL